MKKYIFLFIAFLVGLIWGYGLVFWMNFSFEPEVTFGTTIGWEIILWDEDLSRQVVVFKSTWNIASGYEVSSLCNTSSRYLDNYKNLYFFEIFYLDELCQSSSVVLKKWDILYPQSTWNVVLSEQNNIFDSYLDHSNTDLLSMQKEYTNTISETAIYKNFNSDEIVKYLSFALWQRRYREAFFHNTLISEILTGRESKYLNPVPTRTFSNHATKIPNSWRPYRATYTDGIHHGWDIDGQIGDKIIALDDGLIVRVVRGFDNTRDFDRIIYGSLNDDQQAKNLDVLRGNQVWLKTMKGDVVFYSHLDTIPENIVEWMMIEKWVDIGTVGVTWVPEVGYDDYHLHFAIMKNPYNSAEAGTYDFWDYMMWDWYGRGLSYEDTVALRKNTFE